MSSSVVEKLVMAISSRALFDLEDNHRVYVQEGIEVFAHYQTDRMGPLF